MALLAQRPARPAAVAAPSGYVGVFTRGDDRRMYERRFTKGVGWTWFDHGVPPGTTTGFGWASSAMAAPSGYVGMFAIGNDSQLYELASNDGKTWKWYAHGVPPSGTLLVTEALDTVVAPSGYIGVFAISLDGHLWERYFTVGSGWSWADHGTGPVYSGVQEAGAVRA